MANYPGPSRYEADYANVSKKRAYMRKPIGGERDKILILRDPNNEGHFDFWVRMKRKLGLNWFDYDDYEDEEDDTDLFAPSEKNKELTERQKKLEKEKLKELAKKEEEEYFRTLKEKGMTRLQRFWLWVMYKANKYGSTWVIHIVLVIILLLYTLFGGLIFQLLEADAEKDTEEKSLSESRGELIDTIRSLAAKPKGDAVTKTTLTSSFQKYESDMLATFNANSLNERKDERMWEYWHSVFFSFTVYTTIGYGHMYPETIGGKVVCIFYALIGIPLFLVILADLGQFFTQTCKLLWAVTRMIYYSKSFQRGAVGVKRTTKKMRNEDPDSVDTTLKERPQWVVDSKDFQLPLSVALGILVLYMFIGTVVFVHWEQYGWVDSFYFVFSSIATIGFGDFVPQNIDKLMATIVFLVVGLAITTMCINILREKFIHNLARVTAKVGDKYGLDIEMDIEQKSTKETAEEEEDQTENTK